MQITLEQTQLGLRNSTTRIAFRYGSACLTRCPQAVLGVTIEAKGRVQKGFAGDCLPPSWFDKSPDKDYARQIDEMLDVVALARNAFSEVFSAPTDFFWGWQSAQTRVHDEASRRGYPALLASFGVSLLERALLDAMARASGLSFAEAVRTNIYGIRAGEIHSQLSGLQPADWLPARPLQRVFVRHTVGLGDPLRVEQIAEDELLDDGLPQALEQYVERSGIRYFKIKVSNQLERDLDRLREIAAIVERQRGEDYCVTLDGNEQYGEAEQLDQLLRRVQETPELATFWRNVLAIEQPLPRHVALDDDHTEGIRTLGRVKPVIIDESDDAMDSYPRALKLGYRGVSSKNCKGPIKSLLNAGLTWLANGRGERSDYLMTGEDLCNVGIIPVQSDLCLIALLGLQHVERNGHHYHPGLSYLPAEQREAALAAHPDFYTRCGSLVVPRLEDGRFQIASLQCEGFGFSVPPDFDSMQSIDEWEYASLGLS